ncbi:MAG TPA: DUF2188 domain-containing protein [Marmoricola sp.]|nr:DUF2188 domain-containing protein [Marmoricola sp.]
MSSDVETYFEAGSWRNWSAGQDLGGAYGSREEAVAAGSRVASERRAHHIVRDEHGTVIERTSLE